MKELIEQLKSCINDYAMRNDNKTYDGKKFINMSNEYINDDYAIYTFDRTVKICISTKVEKDDIHFSYQYYPCNKIVVNFRSNSIKFILDDKFEYSYHCRKDDYIYFIDTCNLSDNMLYALQKVLDDFDFFVNDIYINDNKIEVNICRFDLCFTITHNYVITEVAGVKVGKTSIDDFIHF